MVLGPRIAAQQAAQGASRADASNRWEADYAKKRQIRGLYNLVGLMTSVINSSLKFSTSEAKAAHWNLAGDAVKNASWDAPNDWPGLKAIGMVSSRVNKKDKESNETRFYISSFELSTQQLNDIARRHWGIENQLHWRLDVVFNEDKACIRNDNAAENMDIMRKWALNSMSRVKEKPDQSIKGIMRKNSMSFKYLISNVKKIFHA